MTKEKQIKFYTDRLEKVKAFNHSPSCIKYVELQLEAVKTDGNPFDENLLLQAEEHEKIVTGYYEINVGN